MKHLNKTYIIDNQQLLTTVGTIDRTMMKVFFIEMKGWVYDVDSESYQKTMDDIIKEFNQKFRTILIKNNFSTKFITDHNLSNPNNSKIQKSLFKIHIMFKSSQPITEKSEFEEKMNNIGTVSLNTLLNIFQYYNVLVNKKR